jgi:hypothetical protein
MRQPGFEKFDTVDQHRQCFADGIGHEMVFQIDSTVDAVAHSGIFK